ncbi:MAG: hypothetical protein RI967_58 [Planctomycetota bacterium]
MPIQTRGLRICLLTPQDLDAVPFPDNDWPCDPRPFVPDAAWHVATLVGKHECLPLVESLIASGRFDLFFNLCDGAADQTTPGIEVVEALERARVPFVGATSSCYEPTRMAMKAACEAEGVATPRGMIVRGERDIARAARTLRFPLFVKHHNSYASVDLSRRSRVATPAGLAAQAQRMIARHGAALVEEFIEGTECTVLVAENPRDPARPIAYTPIQYAFPKGETFKHEKLKWEEYGGMEAAPVADPALDARLRDECARFFRRIGAASFGRCDVRVDADGVPHVLEINLNCGIYYPPADAGGADLCLAHDPAGHEGFTRTLVEAAFARHARLAKPKPRADKAVRPARTRR